MTAGERLRESRNAKGLSQKELAKISGLSQSFISQLEQEKRKGDKDFWIILAKILNVSVAYLMGEDATTQETLSDTFSEKPQRLFGNQPWGSFPILEPTAIACAGTGNGGMSTIYAEAESFMELPLSLVGTISVDESERPFLIRIEGDSMEGANIFDGSFVAINPAEEVFDGDPALVLFGRNSDCAVKWVYWQRDGGVEIRSASLKYPPRSFTKEDIEEDLFQVVGKVVWTGGKPRSGA